MVTTEKTLEVMDASMEDNLEFMREPIEVSLTFESVSFTENETIEYTFTRTGDTNSSLTVNFALGGSGTLDTDYTLTSTDTFDA